MAGPQSPIDTLPRVIGVGCLGIFVIAVAMALLWFVRTPQLSYVSAGTLELSSVRQDIAGITLLSDARVAQQKLAAIGFQRSGSAAYSRACGGHRLQRQDVMTLLFDDRFEGRACLVERDGKVIALRLHYPSQVTLP
jgi:hypothetical protein